MSIENNIHSEENQPKANGFPLIASGLDENGDPTHSVTGALPEGYPGIPAEVFDKIIQDFDSLPVDNTPLKFSQNEMLELAINSNNKTRYSIVDAKNGYYIIGRVDHREGATEGSFFLSSETVDKENPDLIVCSQERLLAWLHLSSTKTETNTVKNNESGISTNEVSPLKHEDSQNREGKAEGGPEFSSKEKLGNIFLNKLKKSSEGYPLMQGTLSGAMRDRSVFMSGLSGLIDDKEFPQEKKTYLKMLIMRLNDNDPFIESMKYYDKHSQKFEEEKNELAETHNNMLVKYVGTIKSIFAQLEGILPDGMLHELWSKNGMFLTHLDWSKNNGENK